MIMGVYCIRDIKSGYMSPTIEQNDACAVRNFVHAMSNVQSLLHTHPKDFDLVYIGQFDSETGEITGLQHEIVYEGSSYEGSQA